MKPYQAHPGAPSMQISIVVPCRNEAETVFELAERVRALFAARKLEGELIFVDDGSTDHTGALVEGLATRDPFVKVVRHRHSQGIAAAWESGRRIATGRYVVVMDGDLEYLPDDIYRLYRSLDRRKQPLSDKHPTDEGISPGSSARRASTSLDNAVTCALSTQGS